MVSYEEVDPRDPPISVPGYSSLQAPFNHHYDQVFPASASSVGRHPVNARMGVESPYYSEIKDIPTTTTYMKFGQVGECNL